MVWLRARSSDTLDTRHRLLALVATSLMGNARISAVMSVCDNERFVADAVRSMLAQFLQPFEFVIGDDGSRDSTPAILNKLAADNASIRLLRRERPSGPANAFNWVVGAARGEYVALTHADDLSLPERLAQQMAMMERHPKAVLVGAPAVGIDEMGREVHPANLWRLMRPSPFAPFAHSSILFRKDAFIRAGGYRPQADYWEDLDLFWRMARLGPLLALARPVTRYRYSEDSFRSRDAQNKIETVVHRMYEEAETIVRAHRSQQDWSGSKKRSIDPRVFIALSWNNIWRGKRPLTWGRMIRRARLGLDRRTLHALVLIGSATLAPLIVRRILSATASTRNHLVRLRFPEGVTEWQPFGLTVPVRPDERVTLSGPCAANVQEVECPDLR